MPDKPPMACSHPMCSGYATFKGMCDDHKVVRPKPSAERLERNRFYNTAQWKRIRHKVLMNSPLCVECMKHNVLTEATVVDHIIERKLGGSDRLSNLQSMCSSCHQIKTNKDNPRR